MPSLRWRIYSRRQQASQGRIETLEWAASRPPDDATPRRGVAFWHGNPALPESFVDGVIPGVRMRRLEKCSVSPFSQAGGGGELQF